MSLVLDPYFVSQVRSAAERTLSAGGVAPSYRVIAPRFRVGGCLAAVPVSLVSPLVSCRGNNPIGPVVVLFGASLSVTLSLDDTGVRGLVGCCHNSLF